MLSNLEHEISVARYIINSIELYYSENVNQVIAKLPLQRLRF